MKKSLFFILFIAFSNGLLAQKTAKIEQLDAQKRRETYLNRLGYDSVSFTIVGKNDTVLRTTFSENGRLFRREWQDSLHLYDIFGQLRAVYYAETDVPKQYKFQTTTFAYDFDGSLQSRRLKTPTGKKREMFNRKNTHTKSWHYSMDTPSVNYTVETDGKGRKLYAGKISEGLYDAPDSISVHADTIFYDNGQVYYINRSQRVLYSRKKSQLEQKYYARNGTLFVDFISDSLLLTPFKDNAQCLS